MCCGQNRARARQSYSVAPASPISAPATSEQQVRFLGSGSLVVRGTHSGRSYVFSSADPDVSVDARDAEVLLKTKLFRFR